MKRVILLTLGFLTACSSHANVPSPRTGFAEVNGTRLYYEEQGNGRPVVLIHGAMLDRTMWDDQVPELAKGYRVIRYDARGFGRSARSNTPFKAHEDLKGLLDHLSVDRADLIGLSLGGRIAIDFALTYPTRVRSLVLAAAGVSGVPGDQTPGAWLTDMMTAIRARDTIAASDAWLRSEAMTPAMERADLRDRLRTITYANSGIFAMGSNPEQIMVPPARDRLRELRVPVLVLIGTRDAASLRGMSDMLAARVTGARRVWIEGAGHLLNLERPQEFNRAMLDFLNR
ncbi:MAG: alpha/beta fold hydrolase [Gemmatimonadota bacterium]